MTVQLLQMVNSLFYLCEILIVIWCIFSFFPPRHGGLYAEVAGFIDRVVAPFVNIFRRFLPPISGFDFSPALAIVVLYILRIVVSRVLLMLL